MHALMDNRAKNILSTRGIGYLEREIIGVTLPSYVTEDQAIR